MPLNIKHTGLMFLLSIAGTLFLSIAHGQSAQEFLSRADSILNENNYPLALEKYLLTLQVAETEGEHLAMAMAQKNVAVCFYYMRDWQGALKWYYQYLNTVETFGLDSLLANAYYIVGAMYIEAAMVDSAEKYSFRAVELMREAGDHAQLSRTYSTLAQLYLSTSDDTTKMVQMMENAEKYADLSGSSLMAGFAATKRFNYYFGVTKDYRKALEYVSRAEAYYLETGNREAILNAYSGKAQCLIMLRDTAALGYYNKWLAFKDSILNAEKMASTIRYETLYETQKKETALLQQRQLLQEEQRTGRFYKAASAIVALLMLSLFLMFRQRQRHRTELLLKEQNEKAVKEIFHAEQKERIRIARDLHDSIGQKLSVMRMLLSGNRGSTDLQKVSDFMDETAAEVRSISHNLIPEILNFGLMKAIEALADRINSTENVKVRFEVDEAMKDVKLSEQKELSVYRTVQEILSNIVRHSQAEKVDISVRADPQSVQIIIEDNGIGFDTEAIDASQGLGWKNIFARVKLMDGQLKVHSQKNSGSRFILIISRNE